MKENKGFTLIELLAIIVILAIIAVITVPLILGIIDDAKKGSAKDSAYGYKNAVSMFYASRLLGDNNSELEDRVYSISELKAAGLSVSGQEPGENSWITIYNNDAVEGCLQFGEYKVDITNGEISSVEKTQCKVPFVIKYDSLIVTSGDGLYKSSIEPGRLIYKGGNPSNYIWLDENGNNTKQDTELYRIVSFETDGTIKVVRKEALSQSRDIVWDAVNARVSDGTNDTYCVTQYGTSYGCNVWGNQQTTLFKGSALGDSFHYSYYASASATTLTDGPSGKVGNVSGKEATLNSYLNNTWLPDNLSNYIANHKFDVGGVYYTSGFDGGKGLQKEKEEEGLYTWIGKIGLLSITDYVESSSNPNCTSVWSGFYWNPNNTEYRTNGEWPCKQGNYNYKSGNHYLWSISPDYSEQYYVWTFHYDGYFSNGYTSEWVHEVRPVFYLKSDVDIIGDGTLGNPYRISDV